MAGYDFFGLRKTKKAAEEPMTPEEEQAAEEERKRKERERLLKQGKTAGGYIKGGREARKAIMDESEE